MSIDNVYRRIALFYERQGGLGRIVSKARVERYFRSLAWEGKPDRRLRRVFGVVSALLDLMARRALDSFCLLTRRDFVEAFYAYADARPRLRLIEQNVSLFFRYLEGFLAAMGPDGREALTALGEGRALFYEDGAFALPERPVYDAFCDALEHTEEVGAETLDRLNEVLDGLLSKMTAYFQQTARRRDFARAAALFSGPFEPPEEDDEAGWSGFWDYFFFDYHMLAEDVPPLRFYLAREGARLSEEERYVLRDLTRARLTVFSVQAVEDEFALCTDLFSGETLELPCPDQVFADYRRMIFFGHLQRRGVMLLNYITALPASARLRRRIRDEVLRQFERFRAHQSPQASLEDFFVRHAAAVRHTAQILSGFAQLKVVPRREAAVPKRAAPAAALLEPEGSRLEEAARALGFSAYAAFIARRLYEDYVARAKRRGTAAALAAALILVAGVNDTEFAPMARVFAAFGVTPEEAARAVREVGMAIGCVALDPRYLTEEGYVRGLYLILPTN